MDQEKVGQFIKEIRKKNNLTQKQLADKLGVTYQAVSKWENGKNIPDIAILKEISNTFNVDIDEIINGKKRDKKSNKIFFIISIVVFILIILLIVFLLNYKKDNNFEFKTISTDCDNFEIAGSAAYNKDKTSIYISNISYCGDSNDTLYKKIECKLYESYNNTETLISSCDDGNNITLQDYLKDVKINVNNYSSICKAFSSTKLYLQINATDDDNIVTSFQIPITLNENCKVQP